jgi:pantoate--beta-alanine ligase
MRIVTTVKGMRRLAEVWRRQGLSVALVPTMGSLHAGHMSLVWKARQRVGANGKVVVSIYVNPTQFGPSEDFTNYPRDLSGDKCLCRSEGVDAVWVPSDEAMYPGRREGRFSTYVVEESLSRSMEGRSRPEHFRGVTTVVAKLFNVILPDWAVFGAKDFQQAAVVKRMALDLNFPVKIVVAPTVRERDGLAMSSRNRYLQGRFRVQATVLSRAIALARRIVREAGGPVPTRDLQARLRRYMALEPDVRLDYVECFDPETLVSVARVGPGTHLALAVYIGKTRLIDNASLA